MQRAPYSLSMLVTSSFIARQLISLVIQLTNLPGAPLNFSGLRENSIKDSVIARRCSARVVYSSPINISVLPLCWPSAHRERGAFFAAVPAEGSTGDADEDQRSRCCRGEVQASRGRSGSQSAARGAPSLATLSDETRDARERERRMI